MNKGSQFRTSLLALLCVLLMATGKSFGQGTKVRAFGELTGPERWWVVTHLFSATTAFEISKEATAVTSELVRTGVLQNDYQGGEADAFRHAYWMARLAQVFPEKRARRLGEVHEKGNYIDYRKGRLEDGAVADSVSGQMDLWNNLAGRNIGTSYPEASSSEIIAYVLQALARGKLAMIRKSGNKYLSKDGLVIAEEELDQWNTPKVLIPSSLTRAQ